MQKLWHAEHSNGCVDLSHFGLGGDRAAAMAAALESCATHHIVAVNLSGNRLAEAGAALLLAKLHDRTLRKLDISDNKIGELGVRQVERLLTQSHALTSLNLSHTRLKDAHVARVCNAVCGCGSLTELGLARNAVLPRGAGPAAIQAMLQASGATKLQVRGGADMAPSRRGAAVVLAACLLHITS